MPDCLRQRLKNSLPKHGLTWHQLLNLPTSRKKGAAAKKIATAPITKSMEIKTLDQEQQAIMQTYQETLVALRDAQTALKSVLDTKEETLKQVETEVEQRVAEVLERSRQTLLKVHENYELLQDIRRATTNLLYELIQYKENFDSKTKEFEAHKEAELKKLGDRTVALSELEATLAEEKEELKKEAKRLEDWGISLKNEQTHIESQAHHLKNAFDLLKEKEREK